MHLCIEARKPKETKRRKNGLSGSGLCLCAETLNQKQLIKVLKMKNILWNVDVKIKDKVTDRYAISLKEFLKAFINVYGLKHHFVVAIESAILAENEISDFSFGDENGSFELVKRDI